MNLTKRQIDNAVEITIRDIECLAHVTNFEHVEGSFSRDAPSDLDYKGYSLAEFDLYDLEGVPLHIKLTDEEEKIVEDKIINHFL